MTHSHWLRDEAFSAVIDATPLISLDFVIFDADGRVLLGKRKNPPGTHIYNLGTGKPVSVLQLVNVFTDTTGVDVHYTIAPRRQGDLPAFWADSSKAQHELGWQAYRTLSDMVSDTWNWQQQNPMGYMDEEQRAETDDPKVTLASETVVSGAA